MLVKQATEVSDEGERGMAEMEMRAREDVEIGCDITPAILPISFSLHDAFLRSHCSACFSPLPRQPFLPRRHCHLSSPSSSSVFYCSPLCSATDSSLHFSSAESNLLDSSPLSSSFESSADLRAALRLLRTSSSAASGDRMFGLLTNREKLLAEGDEISDRVRSGATAMATARGRRNAAAGAKEEESAICMVITNGVEVVDEKGRGIGIAVYGSGFSWINHSCSPNACYRFLLPSSEVSPSSPDSALRIVPSGPTVENAATVGGCGYGPRMVVRSIRRIEKGEEVTVAYTDLLQPKAARSSELWSKYRFICCCKRCSSSSSSSSYVDHALEEISTSQSFDNDEATGRLLNTDYVDEIITYFLSDDGDPETCCRKLEHLLISGLSGLKLHPLHHLAINAYTTLSSAYRIHASVLTSHHHCPEAFSKTRTSAAYALFLAAAANHLFTLEPSLIACVANYWASAGECLITLARSSSSSSSSPCAMAEHYKCSKCSPMDALKAVSYGDFENVKLKFVDCISGYARRSWGFLSKGCDYLEQFEDAMDFSWVERWPASTNWDGKCGLVVAGSMDDIWQLGAHCLVYGRFLAGVCHGEQSPWISQIQRLLCYER